MTPILGFLLVIGVAFISAVLIFPRVNRKNPIISGIAISGIPYILIGVLFGPHFSGLLNENILLRLEPLISLSLGWAGMLFGINLRWKKLKRFPRNYMLFAATQSLISFVVILAICWSLFYLFAPLEFEYLPEATLILAALGCNTTPLTIARTILVYKIRGRLTHLIQFVSSFDTVWGILFAGMTFSLCNPVVSEWITGGWQWLLLTLLLGIVIGFAYVYLIRGILQYDELMLFVFGLVIFASGIGFYLHLSPIFLNMIVGVVIAQFRREAEKTNRILEKAETQIYLILLIFAGALWNFNILMELFLIFVFIAARFIGKYAGGYVSARNINCEFPIPRDVGKSLQSFGGISLAIALNFQLFYGNVNPFSGNMVISATIIGIIIFDEYAAWVTPRILRRQGEVA